MRVARTKSIISRRMLTLSGIAGFVLLCCVVVLPGCGETDTRTQPTTQTDAAVQKRLNEDCFQWIANVINDPELFLDVRTHEQLIDRLNQWAAERQETDDWKPDPLLKDLPPELRRPL